jgi:hypothetical protein
MPVQIEKKLPELVNLPPFLGRDIYQCPIRSIENFKIETIKQIISGFLEFAREMKTVLL